MANEIQPMKTPGVQLAPGNTTNIGSVDTVVAHANQVQNNYIFGGSGLPGAGAATNLGAPPKMDMNFYNLFVLPPESFINGGFRVQKTDALQDTDGDAVRQLTMLGENEQSLIRSYPTVVAMPNEQCGVATPGCTVHYGFITSIQVCDTSIIFGFMKLQEIPQSLFIDNAALFGIGRASAYNEFDRTHWAVKKVNVVEELRKLGTQVIVFSY